MVVGGGVRCCQGYQYEKAFNVCILFTLTVYALLQPHKIYTWQSVLALVRVFRTPWTVAGQAPLSSTILRHTFVTLNHT